MGRERIQVVHGGADKLISIKHGETLAQQLGVNKVVLREQGHVLVIEERAEVKRLVTEIVEKSGTLCYVRRNR